jgi:outer membrane protein OmpA-like peptidoglycan-associated protein
MAAFAQFLGELLAPILKALLEFFRKPKEVHFDSDTPEIRKDIQAEIDASMNANANQKSVPAVNTPSLFDGTEPKPSNATQGNGK